MPRRLHLPDIATTCTLSSSSLDRDDHVRTLAPRVLLQPPPRLEQYAPPPGLDKSDAHLCASHGIPVKAAPAATPSTLQLSQSRPHSLLFVPSMLEHILCAQLLPAREVLVPPWRESTILSIQILVHGLALFLNREPLFFLWSTLVNPNLMGTVALIQSTVISCIINIRLSLLQWNPGPARRNPTNIVSVACGKFHAVILQEASDHVPHISGQFLVCTGNTDLAILLNKDTFEPDPIVLTYKVDSTSKGTWCMVLLIVRGLLRRPSLSGSPTVTFCSVHIHNVVAKKRDASTELLQRLYGYF